jgi:hypothetical protein
MSIRTRPDGHEMREKEREKQKKENRGKKIKEYKEAAETLAESSFGSQAETITSQ